MQGSGLYESDDRGRLCFRPLAPTFPKLDDVWDQLDPACRAIEAFDRALGVFPIPGLVGTLFARIDAVHSSGAEGSTTTFTDLMEFETILKRAADAHDAAEVASVAAAFETLAESAMSPQDLILAIHHRLFRHSTDPMLQKQAGQWKTVPNATFDDEIGGPFYYCAPHSLEQALGEWQDFTMAQDGKPELLRQALSHWMFEHIHPVPDGNGRVGRLLVPILMHQKGGLQYASAFMGEAVHLNKSLYIDGLKSGRRSGELAGWTRIFCSLMAQTANANLQRLEKLELLLRRWRQATANARSHSVIHTLVPWIITKPTFTIRDVLVGLANSVSFQAVNTAVKRLEGEGMVTQIATLGKDRLFHATEIIDLFEPLGVPGSIIPG